MAFSACSAGSTTTTTGGQGTGTTAATTSTTSGGTTGTVSPEPAVESGAYVAGAQGTPHYYLSLATGSGNAVSGSVNFLYQDGTTSLVFTFTGVVHGGLAQLHPTTVATNAGSATQDPATVPKSISATVGHGSLTLSGCTAYLHFAPSPAACTFTYSPTGVH